MTLLRRARRRVGMTRRWLFPPPEAAAWRRAWHQAETTPRFTPGVIRMLDLELWYADLLSFCPQWEDIFVKRALDFEAGTASPRILDCGANVGLASLYFLRRYPGARITAFEADPDIFAMLKENLARNDAATVEVVHAALWTANDPVTFQSEGSDSGMIAGLPGQVDGSARTVPGRRLRDVIAREPVDMLKLDVEGAEGAVLADCEPVLDRVRALILDLHEFDPAARQTPSVLTLLDRAGFDYALDDLVQLPWRDSGEGRPAMFPRRSRTWAVTVRAWRRA